MYLEHRLVKTNPYNQKKIFIPDITWY